MSDVYLVDVFFQYVVCLFILLMIVFGEAKFSKFEVQYINMFSFVIHLFLCPKKSLPDSRSLRFFYVFYFRSYGFSSWVWVSDPFQVTIYGVS